eukprot:m.224198 g.224198  ORF g.224198 m.224198 type:complete len:63 (-) comp15948_c0_seq5:177-365(-)
MNVLSLSSSIFSTWDLKRRILLSYFKSLGRLFVPDGAFGAMVMQDNSESSADPIPVCGGTSG